MDVVSAFKNEVSVCIVVVSIYNCGLSVYGCLSCLSMNVVSAFKNKVCIDIVSIYSCGLSVYG